MPMLRDFLDRMLDDVGLRDIKQRVVLNIRNMPTGTVEYCKDTQKYIITIPERVGYDMRKKMIVHEVLHIVVSRFFGLNIFDCSYFISEQEEPLIYMIHDYTIGTFLIWNDDVLWALVAKRHEAIPKTYVIETIDFHRFFMEKMMSISRSYTRQIIYGMIPEIIVANHMFVCYTTKIMAENIGYEEAAKVAYDALIHMMTLIPSSEEEKIYGLFSCMCNMLRNFDKRGILDGLECMINKVIEHRLDIPFPRIKAEEINNDIVLMFEK